MAKAGSFLQRLRQQIAASGQSKKGIWFVKPNQKRRIRFLKNQDLEQGITIPWHSKWEGNRSVVDSPCLEAYGKGCPFCGVEDVRIRDRFAWTIYDYEQKQRQIFLFYANRNSPIPHLASVYEEYNTLTDRDLVIQKTGEGTDGVFTVLPGSPSKFRVEGIRPWSVAKILDMVWKAFGQGDLEDYNEESEDEESDDDEYDEESDDDENDDSDDDDSEEDEELPRKPVRRVAAANTRRR
jgi:hypothetical protein